MDRVRPGITKRRNKYILHVGCGTEHIPEWLEGREIRLDIDPAVKPDIVASMTDMGEISGAYLGGDGFHAVYCCHALEHLYPYDVPVALKEFYRVLRPGGVAIIIVPDLEGVEPTGEILYESPAGPVAGLDLIYGYRPFLKDQPYMAHHTGFIEVMLRIALAEAGFEDIETERHRDWNLMGWGVKPG